jgi:DNA-binding beta-propeller fold protein YncE
MYLLVAAALAVLPRLLARFGGEDPIKGDPFYHEKITREAALQAGWTGAGEAGTPPGGVDDRGAANGLAWPADNVDTYLYNQIWNASGGISRFKSAMFAHDDLVKVHFDDLTSTAQIERMWSRYLGGAVAGVLWAMDRDDVTGARHVVGVCLHALQDFYSHSNWVDVPGRRTKTWGETPAGNRSAMSLYTGTYETDEDFGFKAHGKYAIDCTLMREVIGEDIMDTLCDGLSPLSDSGLCRRWAECKQDSVPVHPDVILGVHIPRDIVYLEPPGIALDNTWLARINAHNRDLPANEDPAAMGLKLFGNAVTLATRHSAAWLGELGGIISGLGPAEAAFWERVSTEARPGELHPSTITDALAYTNEDLKQFEQPSKLPSTFLSAGAYPPDPAGGDEGWFVRLELHTADDEFGTGTNSDIDAVIGGATFRLDHGHEDNRLLEFNDFESGDFTWYVVGPFAQRPAQLTLVNNGTTIVDIIEAAWNDFKNMVASFLETIGELLLSFIGGNADYCGSDKRTWSWPELVDVAKRGGEDFELHCVVDGEGDYRIQCRLEATFQPNGNLRAKVRPLTLVCVHESTIDQGSSDDEPFVLLVVDSPALSDGLRKGRSRVFHHMDSGESTAMDMPAIEVDVPRHGGLIVPAQVWESDEEGSSKRDQLLEEFARRYRDDSGSSRSEFLDAIGAAVLPDWKLAGLDAYAYRRGYLTRTAHLVRDRQVNRWIEAGGSLTIPFDKTPTRTVLVPALEPAVQKATLLPGGNVSGLAVADGAVFASVNPQVVPGTPAGPGSIRRLGQHLEQTGVVSSFPGARSVATDPVHRRLYTVTQNDAVRMYDLDNLQLLASHPIGFGAFDVAVDPGSELVWVSRWRVEGGAVLVLRGQDLSPVTEITDSPSADLFHGTEGLAADPDGIRAYVARSFRSGGPDGPVATAYSIMLKDAAGGYSVADLELSDPLIQPVDVAVDAPSGLVFVAGLGGGGTHPQLLVISRDGAPAVKGVVLLPGSARAVATRPGTGFAYVATDDGLCLVDGRSRTLELTVPLGPAPTVVAVDPTSGATFVGDRVDGTVRRVDTAAILG